MANWIKLGSTNTTNMWLGSTQVDSIYLADVLVWRRTWPAPTGFAAVAGDTNVVLTWNAVAGLEGGYDVYYSTTNTYATSTYFGFTTNLTNTVTGLTNGTPYYFWIASANILGVDGPVSTSVTATPAGGAPVKPNYRYIRFQGYGSTVVGSEATTRGIELEIVSGGTNRVLNKTIISTEAVSTGTGTPAQLINGTKTVTANSYPIWWTTVPNGNVVIDMGAQYLIDSAAYYSYSQSGDQRVNRFAVQGSNTNNGTDWYTFWDNSVSVAIQPILPSGYTKTFPSAP